MPNNIISIGFNLDGYTLKDNSAATAGEGISIGGDGTGTYGGGVVTDWGSLELDEGRWVKDQSLKQVAVQCSFYQNTPAQYTNSEGKTGYVCLGDTTGIVDGAGDAGGLAFGGAIAGGLYMKKESNQSKYGTGSKIRTWLNQYESGRTNFVCGCGVSPNTITDYLNHFYPGINADKKKHVYPLLRAKILNAEIVYNIGGGQGKAVRLKIVDSPGDNNGSKGTAFKYKKDGKLHVTPYDYDVFDTMLCCLLTSDFDGVVKIGTPRRNGVSNVSFPFKSYNYKTATIDGYGPDAILSYDFTEKSIDPVSFITWTSSGPKSETFKWPLGKVRFFIDEENRGKAQQILPNCPDDLFKTNYSVGQTTSMGSFNGTLNLTGVINNDIVRAAQMIDDFIRRTNQFTYGSHKVPDPKNPSKTITQFDGGGAFFRKPDNAGDIWGRYSYPGNWIIGKNNSHNGMAYHTDCSHYVTWVLNEVGILSASSQFGSASFANMENMKLNNNYKAIKVPSVAEILPGDILVWTLNGRHHAGIAAIAGNNSDHYGMGATGYMLPPEDSRYRKNPHSDPSANHYFRITKV